MALSESTRAGQMTRDQKVLKKMQLSIVPLNHIQGGCRIEIRGAEIVLAYLN
jgi:hypothetical protein